MRFSWPTFVPSYTAARVSAPRRAAAWSIGWVFTRRPLIASRSTWAKCIDRSGAPCLRGHAAQVHEAAHVARHQDVGLRGSHMVELQAAHGLRDMRERHGKGPAKAAALLALAELDEAQPRDGAEEEGHRVAAPRPARVAGAVERDHRVETAGP